MFNLEILSPLGQNAGDSNIGVAARRPNTLDGLTLGLLWNSKRGGDIALAKAGELISRRYKNVKVIRYDGSMP